VTPELSTDLFRIQLDAKWTALVSAHWLIWGIALFVIVILVWRALWTLRQMRDPDIEHVELAVLGQKLKLKPNNEDRQVAYRIWVELSTRKVGLPIDLDNDVIVEVYDSWHAFFTATRELIKDIPVAKAQSQSTQQIINLSIAVLNEGLRPHLTQWQARFRRWYGSQLEKRKDKDEEPQSIQKEYPQFDGLSVDLKTVNQSLIEYRQGLMQIIWPKNP
jgi:hypothetical protein